MMDQTLSNKTLLTIEEAAEHTGVGINRIRNLLDTSATDCYLCIGRHKRMIKRERFDKFLENANQI